MKLRDCLGHIDVSKNSRVCETCSIPDLNRGCLGHNEESYDLLRKKDKSELALPGFEPGLLDSKTNALSNCATRSHV